MNDTTRAPFPAETGADIRLLVLDVDGVLTDGRLHYDADGREQKVFHVRDGYGIKQLQKAGIEVAIISGRQSRALEVRLTELGIEHAFLGRDDKDAAVRELMDRLGVPRSAVACVGDDVPDLRMMREVALGIAVADAHETVIAAADWRTAKRGGRGAVREVADALLAARGS